MVARKSILHSDNAEPSLAGSQEQYSESGREDILEKTNGARL
jgi:hypothetical protein